MIGQMRSRFLAYGLAVLTVGISLLLVFLIHMFFQRGAMLLFLAAVAITTAYGGWGPGLFAALLSGLVAIYFIIPPYHSFAVPDVNDVVRLCLFFLVAVLIARLHSLRDKVQEALKRSEQRLRLALEGARMGAWESNLRTGEFWWSPGVEKIFGRAPGDFSPTYEGFLGYIHPEDRDFVNRAVTRTIEDELDFEIEHRIVRPDGGIRWTVTRGRFFYDASGQVERMVAVVVDVTDSKLREQMGSGKGSQNGLLPGAAPRGPAVS